MSRSNENVIEWADRTGESQPDTRTGKTRKPSEEIR